MRRGPEATLGFLAQNETCFALSGKTFWPGGSYLPDESGSNWSSTGSYGTGSTIQPKGKAMLRLSLATAVALLAASPLSNIAHATALFYIATVSASSTGTDTGIAFTAG